MFEVLNFLKICPIFVGTVHDFGRSDGKIIDAQLDQKIGDGCYCWIIE